MALITPRTPPGTMELLPRRQVAFQRVLDTIRGGYERFGFMPIETPVFETVETLLTKSGGETEKQVYFVQSTGALQRGHKPELAMRFDLTIPLARYVAEHERELAFPFRRYQIQRVYRGERAQRGRFREFYQCDIDVIGKDALPIGYDAELPAVIHHVFGELGFGGFTINVNNRKILLGLLESLGVDDAEKRGLVLREIDKLDKIGRDKVRASLVGDGVSVPEGVADTLLDLIAEKTSSSETIARLKTMTVDNPTFQAGVCELAAVISGVAALGVPEEAVAVNLAIARGLDYYTGTVYETFLNDHKDIGSICSGGRYEDLAGHYTKSRLPGVGISIGVTRLFHQLIEAGLIADGASVTDVLIADLDPTMSGDYLRLAATLRAAGLNVEVPFEGGKLAKQMKYADRAGIPVVVLMGSDERAKGVASVRLLAKGEQFEAPFGDLAAKIKSARTK